MKAKPQYFNQAFYCNALKKELYLNETDFELTMANGTKKKFQAATETERVALQKEQPHLFSEK